MTPPGRSPACWRWALRIFLLASAILGILAQRLVRVICPECRTAVPLEYEVEEWRRMQVGWAR